MAPAYERRKHERRGYEMPLEYSLSVVEFKKLQKVNSSGTAVDISDEGIGFLTSFPLEPGHILRIKKEADSFQTAMVRWVGKFEEKFRVGVLLYK
ncbi:MAG: PilZ domain-containing protein [Nitrospirota bacterium]